MRRPEDGSVFLALTPIEVETIDALCACNGGVSRSNLLRIALFNLATDQDIAMPNGVFDMRESTGRPPSGKPHKKFPAKRVSVRVRAGGDAGPDHPFRRPAFARRRNA